MSDLGGRRDIPQLGHDVREAGEGERILSAAIERFTCRADGSLWLLTPGSMAAFAETRTHAGICKVKRSSFDMLERSATALDYGGPGTGTGVVGNSSANGKSMAGLSDGSSWPPSARCFCGQLLGSSLGASGGIPAAALATAAISITTPLKIGW
jgi:hypothetical protein